ncbi:MAG: hypothetical protein HQK50_11390 [Oligoflexia bacterium]|nr:hypothetical protein [Oligoflexia bacterium]
MGTDMKQKKMERFLLAAEMAMAISDEFLLMAKKEIEELNNIEGVIEENNPPPFPSEDKDIQPF